MLAMRRSERQGWRVRVPGGNLPSGTSLRSPRPTPPSPLSHHRMTCARAARAPGTAALALSATLLGLASGRARAVPIDEPHIGGIGFSGPTTGDLGAVY